MTNSTDASSSPALLSVAARLTFEAPAIFLNMRSCWPVGENIPMRIRDQTPGSKTGSSGGHRSNSDISSRKAKNSHTRHSGQDHNHPCTGCIELLYAILTHPRELEYYRFTLFVHPQITSTFDAQNLVQNVLCTFVILHCLEIHEPLPDVAKLVAARRSNSTPCKENCTECGVILISSSRKGECNRRTSWKSSRTS